MSNKKPQSYRDCKNGEKVKKYAEKSGLTVREGKGSHFMMKKGSDTMTAYHGEISNGVAMKIWKFFMKVGVACLAVLYVASMWM